MSDTAASAWAPLRITIFRTLWIAVLVSNVGTWMQTVGAQWLLVHDTHAALLVPLVQTATALPAVLFSPMAGVLADILDRRLLLLSGLLGMTVVGVALTVLTAADRMPASLLLTFTFALGAGAILIAPTYQSLVPNLVPRDQLRTAAALSSINVNLARAVGPALAGVVIARTGVTTVFALNTATFLVYAIVVVSHPRLGGTAAAPEGLVSGLRAGGRYVRHAPVVRRILLRASLFLVPGSALWALLPLVATRRLGLGSGGYGVLLGALGVGAVGGAVVLPRLRGRLSNNATMAVASVVYAAALVVVGLSPDLPLSLFVLLLAGAAWITFLSNVNASLQLFLPEWVRGRGLSVYQMVLFGGQAAGALIWGVVADTAGLAPSLIVAALVMAAGAATVVVWPFQDTNDLDRSLVRWPEPELVFEPELPEGPVLIEITYTVAGDKEREFLQSMVQLKQSRLRTGGTAWGLYRPAQGSRQFVEFFRVPTWEEHLRQHRERQTGTDVGFHDAVFALSDPPPTTTHYLAVDVGP
jgi:MFS family permease